MYYKIVFEIVFLTVVLTPLCLADGNLASQNVTEGSCNDFELEPWRIPFWMFRQRDFYVTAASEYAYRNFAELFLGCPAKDEDQLNQMCLKVEVTRLTQFVIFGYDKWIHQTCYPSYRALLRSFNGNRFRCRIKRYARGTQPSLFSKYEGYVVMTDYQTYSLIARCVNGSKDYILLTSSQNPPMSVFMQALAKVQQLGFDPKYFTILPCTRNYF